MAAQTIREPDRQNRERVSKRERRAGKRWVPGGGVLGWGVVVGALGALVWLLVDPRTPDLAAQVYRVNLFRQVGFSVWDERWYAGHLLPGYSLTLPPLASLLGLRTVGALAVVCSAACFQQIARDLYGRAPRSGRAARSGHAPRSGRAARWGAVWFALGALADVWNGRVTFALGVALALACALALLRERRALAVLLALLCAASSPVAGALLALAGLSLVLAGAPRRAAMLLVVPVAVVFLALLLLFPEGGYEPYPTLSFLATAAVVLGFLVVLPRARRVERICALVYLVVCVLCLGLHSPVGSNIERYGVLLAGPVLLCCLLSAPAPRRGLWPAVCVLLGIAVWVGWGPVRETAAIAGNASTQASYYVPVERYVAAHGGARVRVEVPFTRSHWEATWLAPTVSLARGWEKQLDERYDGVLLGGHLTAASYRGWLRREAVAYIALPDTTLDPSSRQEGRLIEGGLPYLRPVFTSRHWRVYRVLGGVGLVEGPGQLAAMGHDSFALAVNSPGSLLVRVHYTRYFAVTRGSGCVERAPGGWTEVNARTTGLVAVTARFSLGRALGDGGGSCATGYSSGSSVGLASGSKPSRNSSLSRHISQRTPDYHWLIAVNGLPPSIERENRALGTSAWRLPGPAGPIGGIANGQVEGYVANQEVRAGQTERVYVNAPGARTVSIQIFRMGWYAGKGGRLVLQSAALASTRQPPCAHRFATGLTECRWHPTLSFPIPPTLTSGVYIVKLHASDGAERDCIFVVGASHPTPLLVEIPTATYEAYNAWGGDSLYPGGTKHVGVTGTNQGVEVSYDRPYDSQTGAGQFFIREIAMVRFLERYGYPVSYTTIESIDREPNQVVGVKALMDVGHSEYWSQRDAQTFAAARDHGTSLIFISSDTMAWRVRFARATRASSQAGEADHVIVAYKETVRRDPDRALSTGLFPLGGANLTGSSYNGCITPRVPGPGPPTYRYYAWTPAPTLRPSWLFAGSGVNAGTRIPGIVGYELDQRTLAAPLGTHVIGAGTRVPCLSEDEPSPIHGRIAQTTLYTAPSGALVFSTGTLGWEYALSPVPQASPDAPRAPDPRVVAITRNLLRRVLGVAGSSPPG
jgi:hypothetical protein